MQYSAKETSKGYMSLQVSNYTYTKPLDEKNMFPLANFSSSPAPEHIFM